MAEQIVLHEIMRASIFQNIQSIFQIQYIAGIDFELRTLIQIQCQIKIIKTLRETDPASS